jgi:hypothetical protein
MYSLSWQPTRDQLVSSLERSEPSTENCRLFWGEGDGGAPQSFITLSAVPTQSTNKSLH